MTVCFVSLHPPPRPPITNLQVKAAPGRFSVGREVSH